MKKIRYNSWIARKFLFEDYNTITLFAWVCTKYETKQAMPQHVRNHECTHSRQWVECMLVSGVIIWGLVLFADISAFWFILSFFLFYILYVLEWLIKLIPYGKKAYCNIGFEREAHDNENDNCYLENGCYFGWIKRLLK
jgi:hypothetical protein